MSNDISASFDAIEFITIKMEERTLQVFIRSPSYFKKINV